MQLRLSIVCAALVLLAAPSYAQPAPVPARLVLLPDTTGPVISRHIYGHFAEHLGRDIYDGFWVGEGSPIPNVRGIRTDIVDALKTVGVPNLRWPGGCFADDYRWKNGIGPKAERPAVPNRWWGHVMEDNAFGTHEFMDLADQLGAEAYIAGNLGSGSVQDMADWAEYLTASDKSPMAELRRQNGREEPWKIPFFGVGNENWGCGGNMNAAYYANEFKRYATFVYRYGRGMKLVAAGPGAGYGGYGTDLEWTETLMREAGWMMGGYSLHYYTVTHNWSQKGSATEFEEADWFLTLKKATWIDSVIVAHSRVMDRYDPEKRVGIFMDEWGTWHDAEPGTPGYALYQQNSLRDALVAAISLNSFNNHADRVRGANLAQTINVLQAMILTEGGRMLKTPTYHAFDLFRPHWDQTLVPSRIEGPTYAFGDDSMPALTASVSRDSVGTSMHVTVSNADPIRAVALRIPLDPNSMYLQAFIVTADRIQEHNTFDEPERISKQSWSQLKREGDHALLTVPPKSVVSLTVINARRSTLRPSSR